MEIKNLMDLCRLSSQKVQAFIIIEDGRKRMNESRDGINETITNICKNLGSVN